MSSYAGEFSRGNMPFELGLDFGCRNFSSPLNQKSILILEEKKYSYQKFISDLSGNDIHAHDNNPVTAIRVVRKWISAFDEFGSKMAANKVSMEYTDFWDAYDKELRSKNFSQDDIDNLPTTELMDAMKRWWSNLS